MRGTVSGTRSRLGRPAPESSRQIDCNDTRRSAACTCVHGTYGGAEPIDTVRVELSAASRPARAVIVNRVPTTRHTALPASASATEG